jgi:hypothetical protein
VFDWLRANVDAIVKRIPPPYHPALAEPRGRLRERPPGAGARAVRAAPGGARPRRSWREVTEQVDECLALRTREAPARARVPARTAGAVGRGPGSGRGRRLRPQHGRGDRSPRSHRPPS